MAVLVSPGVSVQIVNESFYIPQAAPTVPLIFLATRADKKQANGVTPAAGALEHSIVRQITSLNQSVSTYGVPAFRTLTGTNDGGTPLHGDARNEYGLFALNQALTILSNAYVVRADVDLADSPVTIWGSSTPAFVATGGSTATGYSMSSPVVNQATAKAETWTLTAAAGSNGVTAGTIQLAGSGYVAGSYLNVPLIYSSGPTFNGVGATANITVAGVTPGTSTVLYTATAVTGSTLAGIAGGSYTFKVTVNGGAALVYTITATGTDTFSSLAGLMTNASLGLFTVAVDAATPGGFVLTSSTLGSLSSLVVTIPAGTGTDLFQTISTAFGGAVIINTPTTGTNGVTNVQIVTTGSGYDTDDILSAASANLGGGTPVAFEFAITSVAPTTFSVTGSLSGLQGYATVGALYTNFDVSFTINQGTVVYRAGDAWSFAISSTGTVTSVLGANDAAKRASIVTALKAEINGNTNVRSEIYEYNLILCPGYYEVVGDLLNLSLAINEEAFVIADTPFTNTPEQTATWGSTVARQISQNVAYYYPHGLASNLDGNTVFTAASGTALKTYAYSDSVSEVWYPPAGTRRGVVTGLQDIGYITGTLGTATTFVSAPLNQGQRDLLYQFNTNINPIPYLPGHGIIVMGQKTSPSAASALDRVNVMRMMMLIKRDIRKSSMSYLFELNDRITRDSIKQMIDNYLNDILQRRGLYDFVTICDESNNTPQRINNNELHVDIAVSPTKAAEFIYIPIRVVAAGTSLAGGV